MALQLRTGVTRWCLGCVLACLCACGPDPATGTGGDAGDVVDATGGSDGAAATDIAGPDVAANDIASSEDTSNCQGGVGCPCLEPTDCTVPICLDTADGGRCSGHCGFTACPDGWVCKGAVGGRDSLATCVPEQPDLCRPCQDDAGCQQGGHPDARCVDHGDAGGFCGSACGDDTACPKGYDCRVVASVTGGAELKQCVPQAQPGAPPGAFGACSCSDAAVAKSASTACHVVVGSGAAAKRCLGSRSCSATGLGSCTALSGASAACLDVQCLDAKSGQPLVDGTPCDDGRACTVGDACGAGVCVAGGSICPCEPGVASCPKPAAGDAGNPCKGEPLCLAAAPGAAVPFRCAITSYVQCEATGANPCLVSACDTSTATCVTAPVERVDTLCDVGPDAAGQPLCRTQLKPAAAADSPPLPCDDGQACSSDDACSKGLCKGVSAACLCQGDADCLDDGNLCNGAPYCDKSGPLWSCKTNPATVIACDTSKDGPCVATTCQPATGGCAAAPLPAGATCTDGVACSEGDACDGKGACASGAWVCCASDTECLAKDDGDKCNGLPFCNKQTGACQLNPASIVSCPTVGDTACLQTQCQVTSGSCVAVATPAGKGCDDGQVCTGSDACDGQGSCIGQTPICACAKDADCVAKDDGKPCNGTLYCNVVSGMCLPNPSTVVSCSNEADTPCRHNRCVEATGTCSLVDLPAKSACDDGSVCTSGDSCDGKGGCNAGAAICACTSDADCAPFEDGNLCNGTLYCDMAAGGGPACKVNPKTVKVCPTVDDTACTVATCAPKTGACQLLPRPVGAPCQDGLACTGGDACDGKGTCTPGANVCPCKTTADCAVFDPPGVAPCGERHLCGKAGGGLGCALGLPTAGTPCSDGDACTIGDLCDGSGKCLPGKSKVCDDGNTCTLDACVSGGCSSQALESADCDDGVVCSVGDLCKGGACVPGPMLAWSLSYGGGESESARAIEPTPGGEVWVVGSAQSKVLPGGGKVQGPGDGWLVRVGSDGTVVANHLLGGSADDDLFALAVAGDARYAAGRTDSVDLPGAPKIAGKQDGWVVRLDASGSVAWHATVGGSGADQVRSIAATGNGVVVAGVTEGAGLSGDAAGDDGLVAQLDAAGKVVWQKAYGGAGVDAFSAVVAIAGGGVVAAGFSASLDIPGGASSAGDTDGWLLKLDAAGQVLWSKALGSKGADALSGVVALPSGALVAVGAAASQPLSDGGFGAVGTVPWLLKLTASGALAAQRSHGLPALAVAVRRHVDGTLVIAGGATGEGSGADVATGVLRVDESLAVQSFSLAAFPSFAAMALRPDGRVLLAGHSKASPSDLTAAAVTDFGKLGCVGGEACATKTWKACDDADPCTLDGCDTGKGCSHAPLSCDDSDPCTTDSCALGTCKHAPASGGPCEDGSVCTIADACVDGACVSGKAKSCDDGDLCNSEACDPEKGCVSVAANTGLPCPGSPYGTCEAGACKARPCPVGYDPVKVDDKGVSVVQCAAYAPIWGARPLSPNSLSKSTVAGNVVVLDSVTKLMWTLTEQPAKVQSAAIANCDQLSYGSYTDWRLPTVHELAGMVDYSLTTAPLVASTMTGTTADYHWTATPRKDDSNLGYAVSFWSGGVGGQPIGVSSLSRCVRTTAVIEPKTVRWSIPQDDVAVDTWTGLQWQRKGEGSVTSWAAAKAFCGDLVLGGKSDWRLPSVRELHETADMRQAPPSFDTSVFVETADLAYASGSDAFGVAGKFWGVYGGVPHASYVPQTNASLRVRCVRSGS